LLRSTRRALSLVLRALNEARRNPGRD